MRSCHASSFRIVLAVIGPIVVECVAGAGVAGAGREVEKYVAGHQDANSLIV
jgi:hypothetical protein